MEVRNLEPLKKSRLNQGAAKGRLGVQVKGDKISTSFKTPFFSILFFVFIICYCSYHKLRYIKERYFLITYKVFKIYGENHVSLAFQARLFKRDFFWSNETFFINMPVTEKHHFYFILDICFHKYDH